MAKDIKNQLWNEHFNVSIPELQEQQREKQPQLQMVYAKLPSTERNNKFISGLVLACKTAWSTNMEQQEAKDEITVEATSLWKICVNEKDIYKLANSLQYHIHTDVPEVYAKIDVSHNEVLVRLIDRDTITPPFVKEWLNMKVKQRETIFSFDKLESFYKSQPRWVQHKYKFLEFIEVLFNVVKDTNEDLVTFKFKINKKEKRVDVLYSSTVANCVTTVIEQRDTEVPLDTLQSLYHEEPKHFRKHGFISFLKRLFEVIKTFTNDLLSFNIDQKSKKVTLQYAS